MIMNSSGKIIGPILLFQKIILLFVYSLFDLWTSYFSHEVEYSSLIVIDFINLKNTVVDKQIVQFEQALTLSM